MKDKKLFIPSIADILFVSIFLFLSFHAGNSLLNDGDTGYHIRTGELILDTFSIPYKDPFSYLHPPLPWTAHEWLSQVIMALIHRVAGLTGIVIFFSFIISSVYFILFKIIRTYNGNILAAILITVLVIASSQLHWLARPHIFSLLLILIWYYILDEFQYKNKNYLYLLPPIMLLWINLHGGFIVGFFLIGIYLFGNLFKAIVYKDMEGRRMAKGLGLIMLLCLAASLINPYGYNILLFPFKLTSTQFIMSNVNEFLSPNFHEPMFFTYLLFIMIAILAISKARLNVLELTLTLLFTYMALYSVRHIPIFAIIIAPILLRQVQKLVDEPKGRLVKFLNKRAERIAAADASAKGYLLPAVAVTLVIVFAATGKMEFGFDKKLKPVDAVEFLKKEKLHGNMFNNDEFGDYIIYAAWPQYKVFFDGRSDMYGADRMKEYFKITRIQPGWDKVIEKYNIDWIIFNSNSALSLFLMERDEWKLIYADKVANIFVRNIPENQFLISKYNNVNLIVEDDKQTDRTKK